MSKNPFINAVAASLYIITLVLVMNWGSQVAPKNAQIMAPIVMLSLFTLSAAVMAYLFGYQPVQMYFDGKKKQAVRLFLQTVAVFGGLTVLVMGALFSGLVK